jgi:hypothetical protein
VFDSFQENTFVTNYQKDNQLQFEQICGDSHFEMEPLVHAQKTRERFLHSQLLHKVLLSIIKNFKQKFQVSEAQLNSD